MSFGMVGRMDPGMRQVLDQFGFGLVLVSSFMVECLDGHRPEYLISNNCDSRL